jgi:hypothetical protein
MAHGSMDLLGFNGEGRQKMKALNASGEKVPSCIRSDRSPLVDHFGSGNFELCASQIVVTRAPVYKLGSPEQTMPLALSSF